MPPTGNDGPPSFLGYLAIGVGCLIWLGVTTVNSVRYGSGSSQAAGHITDCYSYGTRNHSQTCHYEFRVGSTSYSGSVVGNEYVQDGPVKVTYLSGDPSNNTLDPPSWFPMGLIALVATIASFGICAKLFMSNDDLYHDN